MAPDCSIAVPTNFKPSVWGIGWPVPYPTNRRLHIRAEGFTIAHRQMSWPCSRTDSSWAPSGKSISQFGVSLNFHTVLVISFPYMEESEAPFDQHFNADGC